MFVLILLFILTPSILAAPASLCPTSCSCTSSGIYLNARCNSLYFLQKPLLHEQVKLLVTLDIHNASLTKVNANLNILSNLKSINLSGNKIQHIAPSILPKSVEVLDASHNSIKGNPITCDCDSVLIRDQILNAGIIITHPVKCEHPKEHKGKTWQSVDCKQKSVSLFDGMLGDGPYEGSGSGDVVEKSDVSIENGFIRTTSESTTEADEPEEGSGDDWLAPTLASNEDGTTATDDYEDVTEVIEPVISPVEKEELGSGVVRACNFNCSTPSPIESNDTDTLPAPGLFEGIKIIANDLGLIDDKVDSTTASSELPRTTTEAKEIVRSQNISMDAEIMDKGLNTDEELSNISESSDKQSNSSFIFLAVFLLAIICLVVYVVVKKKSGARNTPAAPPNTSEKDDALEEVELLTKTIDEVDKSNGTPEAVPLINGHKTNEDDVKTTSVNEPEPKKEDNVQLRKHLDDRNTLTPEAKRVTIKAGEIPNSTPKTPVLVIRHMNSDGSIVTTTEVDQRV